MFAAIWTHLKQEGDSIKRAPMAFVIFLAAGCGLGAWSTHTLDKAEMAGDLAGKVAAEADRDNWKTQAQVQTAKGRRLTQAQMNTIVQFASRAPGMITIGRDMGSSDAPAFANDFKTAFEAAGWPTQDLMTSGVFNPSPVGVALVVDDPDHLSPSQAAARNALEGAGISFQMRRQSRDPPGQPEIFISSPLN